jgi:hypothetical protein
MFSEIQISEPIEKVIDDWDFLNDKVLAHFSTFKVAGHNIFGLRQRLISGSGLTDPKKGNISLNLEIGPSGVTEGTNSPLDIRVTPAGVPHRVRHNFGYWHINDKDELYLPIPGPSAEELGYYVVIMGLPKGRETDAFAWYCEECGTLLYDHVIETGTTGLAGFWKGERQAVNHYNADPRLRTCPECGHVNPLGYCWNKAKDTPAEAQARQAW